MLEKEHFWWCSRVVSWHRDCVHCVKRVIPLSPPPVIHSFPAASGPSAAERAHLRYSQIFSLMQKKTSSFLWHWFFFFIFFTHSFQLSTKWWSVFTTEESWCTAPWLTSLKDAGSPPSITSAVVPCTVQPACRVSTSPPLISSSMSASAISPASSWATWTEACWCGPIRRASSSNGCARAESSGWGCRRWGLSAAPCPANWRGTLLWRSLTRNGFSKVRLCGQLAMPRFLHLQKPWTHLSSFVCSSSAAVPGGSASRPRSISDPVFWRGAPRYQQRQEQADHRAGETRPSYRRSTWPNKKLKDPSSPPPPQISVLNCQHLLDSVNTRRSQPYCSNPAMDVSDSAAAEQVAHIYQDLCSYSVPQRSACYRDNMPITAWAAGLMSPPLDVAPCCIRVLMMQFWCQDNDQFMFSHHSNLHLSIGFKKQENLYFECC